MTTKRSRWLLIWTVASGLIVGGSSNQSSAVTPQNQCQGDCSPCLNSASGTFDPFCSSTDPNPDTSGGTTCQICEVDVYPGGGMSAPYCATVEPGEAGRTACQVTTTTTKVSCLASGNSCVGASIHH
jgi:hypothetical protein